MGIFKKTETSIHEGLSVSGTPSIVYTNGANFMWFCLSFFIALPLTTFIFMPVFRRVNSLSVFTYIERRFGTFLSTLSCIIFIFHRIINMGVVLYAPALALSAVTNLSLNGSIITVSVVCLFYTVIGGMKAIIWTDALQVIVMIFGMIFIAVVGTHKVGGLSYVYEINKKGNHLNFASFSFDPRKSSSGFDCIVGGAVTWLAIYSANQASVQRMISIERKIDAQKAILFNIPGLMFFVLVSGYMGLLAYAKYALCDPIKSGKIQKPDQILPYFVIDTFGDWNGFSGLFIASVFSGCLSSVSSGVNAMAAVVLTNMVPEMIFTDATRTKIGKGLAIFFGIASLCFAFVCEHLEAIIPLAVSIEGILGGPILAIFVLGMLTKRTTKIGATVGYLFGLSFQSKHIFSL